MHISLIRPAPPASFKPSSPRKLLPHITSRKTAENCTCPVSRLKDFQRGQQQETPTTAKETSILSRRGRIYRASELSREDPATASSLGCAGVADLNFWALCICLPLTIFSALQRPNQAHQAPTHVSGKPVRPLEGIRAPQEEKQESCKCSTLHAALRS